MPHDITRPTIQVSNSSYFMRNSHTETYRRDPSSSVQNSKKSRKRRQKYNRRDYRNDQRLIVKHIVSTYGTEHRSKPYITPHPSNGGSDDAACSVFMIVALFRVAERAV